MAKLLGIFLLVGGTSFLVAPVFSMTHLASANVSYVTKDRKYEKLEDGEAAAKKEEDLELRNDGSLDDLYRHRKQQKQAAEKMMKMVSGEGIGIGGGEGEETSLPENDGVYISNIRCPELDRNLAYPYLCRFFKDPSFSAAVSKLLRSDRWPLFGVTELIFFFGVCLVRAGRRSQAVSITVVFEFFKELRFSVIVMLIALVLIPGVVFGKTFLNILLGLKAIL